ncbi:MAG: asparagine--tRNA ligase [Kistimonas sp.]|nr:asparagine--tRNA ligase [Kistimonas sp.]
MRNLLSLAARTSVADLLRGQTPKDGPVSLYGWVRTRRDSRSGLSFLSLQDGSCLDAIQVVVTDDLANYTTDIQRLTAGCSLHVQGTLVPSPAKGQDWEIQAVAVEVLGWVDDPETYPMQPKRHTMEHLREYAHLRSRTQLMGAVNRVRHAATMAIHDFFDRHGFIWVNTPVITASDCEGAGEMFRVSTLNLDKPPRNDKGEVDFREDFFGRPAFLTVSGQLNAEALACCMGKVYTFGPTFRAENSNTSRHLSEFWMVEPELAFADLGVLAELASELLRSVCKDLLEQRADDMAFFKKRVDKNVVDRLESLCKARFVQMTYTEAVTLLQKSGRSFEHPVEWGADLQSEHERFLAEEHIGGPLIVTDYPAGSRPFYMRLNDDEKTVAAMDVLVPGMGELVGGSQREERLAVLDARMAAGGLNKDDYSWYRDLRRYGTVPHAGFGLGFERLLGYVTGVNNIRDLIPFPRTPRSLPF